LTPRRSVLAGLVFVFECLLSPSAALIVRYVTIPHPTNRPNRDGVSTTAGSGRS